MQRQQHEEVPTMEMLMRAIEQAAKNNDKSYVIVVSKISLATGMDLPPPTVTVCSLDEVPPELHSLTAAGPYTKRELPVKLEHTLVRLFHEMGEDGPLYNDASILFTHQEAGERKWLETKVARQAFN